MSKNQVIPKVYKDPFNSLNDYTDFLLYSGFVKGWSTKNDFGGYSARFHKRIPLGESSLDVLIEEYGSGVDIEFVFPRLDEENNKSSTKSQMRINLNYTILENGKLVLKTSEIKRRNYNYYFN